MKILQMIALSSLTIGSAHCMDINNVKKDEVYIGDLNKAEVLAALYNVAKPQGSGYLQYNSSPISKQKAEQILEHTRSFEYLGGRVMKIDLSQNTLDVQWFNRNNGNNAAQDAMSHLRK